MIIPKLTKKELNEKRVNNSQGEYLVLKKLETLSNDGRNWVILRSLRLANHATKIEGEIDVIIFTQNQGIILLEIKGSNLRIRNGEWSAFNRGENKWRLIQNPLEQMKDGYFAFKKEYKEIFKLLRINPLISWGCVFPENENLTQTKSYPGWRYCNAINFENLELFLNELVKKEKGKLKNIERRGLGTSMELKRINDLVKKMIPYDDEGKFISFEYNNQLEELNTETKLVSNLMTAFSNNKFIFVEGGAGTGKTKAAIYECKRLYKQRKIFLFWCKSKYLAKHISLWLENELQNSLSIVHSGEILPKNIFSKKFDTLIIDEAQDLVHLDEVKNIILNFNSTKKDIRIFGDFDFQNLYETKDVFLDWLLLNEIKPTNSRLTINCRNTAEIGKKIKNLADFDDSVFSLSSIHGEELQIYTGISNNNLVNTINECREIWIDNEYPESAITILLYKEEYPLIDKKELLAETNSHELIEEKNEENLNKIQFSTVLNFKGLEAPCIILIINSVDKDWQKILYTAISRARLKCFLIFTNDVPNFNIQEILCKI